MWKVHTRMFLWGVGWTRHGQGGREWDLLVRGSHMTNLSKVGPGQDPPRRCMPLGKAASRYCCSDDKAHLIGISVRLAPHLRTAWTSIQGICWVWQLVGVLYPSLVEVLFAKLWNLDQNIYSPNNSELQGTCQHTQLPLLFQFLSE